MEQNLSALPEGLEDIYNSLNQDYTCRWTYPLLDDKPIPGATKYERKLYGFLSFIIGKTIVRV
jgi:hypothetical protein